MEGGASSDAPLCSTRTACAPTTSRSTAATTCLLATAPRQEKAREVQAAPQGRPLRSRARSRDPSRQRRRLRARRSLSQLRCRRRRCRRPRLTKAPLTKLRQSRRRRCRQRSLRTLWAARHLRHRLRLRGCTEERCRGCHLRHRLRAWELLLQLVLQSTAHGESDLSSWRRCRCNECSGR